jgi:membrane-anchored glycerophosphoryl diester phosphodiesterase (GDPDase)
MTGLELRPLSLGEILDRTFSIYRRYFLLFAAITGIPQFVVYGFQLAMLSFGGPRQQVRGLLLGSYAVSGLVLLIVSLVAYLYSQGGTVAAISELYLGRSISITEAFQKVQGNLGFLLGVIVLNGLAVGVATILLVIPGIYVACRLLICIPVAMIEERGPRDSLTRSWELTRDNAGRSFVIVVLFAVLAIAADLLFTFPFSLGSILSARQGGPSWFLTAMTELGGHIASIVTQPIILIATAIFYYDLRVRKEAFDLQFMMNPNAPPAGPGSVPSIL